MQYERSKFSGSYNEAQLTTFQFHTVTNTLHYYKLNSLIYWTWIFPHYEISGNLPSSVLPKTTKCQQLRVPFQSLFHY